MMTEGLWSCGLEYWNVDLLNSSDESAAMENGHDLKMLDETAVHILGGGIGGTVGAIATCPLELVKVRLQSSQGGKFSGYAPRSGSRRALTDAAVSDVTRLPRRFHSPEAVSYCTPSSRLFSRSKILRCMCDVIRKEGVGALFKGLMPTLVGVLPSRGIYFCAYHKGQKFFQEYFPEGHSAVFLFSAGVGSITASTLTCPIWYIKTRLQLDSRPCSSPVTVTQAIRSTWRELGFRGFYRGITASYVGSIETALNFVVYENIKGHLLRWDRLRRSSSDHSSDSSYSAPIFASCTSDHQQQEEASNLADSSLSSNNLRGTQGGSKLTTSSDMMLCMLASGFSKTIAITIAYPHEVARTRMREEGTKYRTFLGTLRTVFAEEGFFGLYRGLGTHYIRQIPNSCLMIGTYEGVVFLLDSWDLVKRT
ncbi:hypothetical protein SprV_0301055500 [Sparganum proliferum]